MEEFLYVLSKDGKFAIRIDHTSYNGDLKVIPESKLPYGKFGLYASNHTVALLPYGLGDVAEYCLAESDGNHWVILQELKEGDICYNIADNESPVALVYVDGKLIPYISPDATDGEQIQWLMRRVSELEKSVVDILGELDRISGR